ncbi:hypothetical protein DV738_g5164, partial [Chaetothyriales sp. CBS 135597]
MREGYDADDIWMMVEDEFQTLAHSFTRHLHHAEYKRLMQMAKQDAAKRKEELLSSLHHPTGESIQLAPRQAKRKLERAALTALQQDSLDHHQSGDPWRGTSLQGLMATGSRQRRSLKGLDRMPSSTRAARGFSRSKGGDGGETGQHNTRRRIYDDAYYNREAMMDVVLKPGVSKRRSRHRDDDDDPERPEQYLSSDSSGGGGGSGRRSHARQRRQEDEGESSPSPSPIV